MAGSHDRLGRPFYVCSGGATMDHSIPPPGRLVAASLAGNGASVSRRAPWEMEFSTALLGSGVATRGSGMGPGAQQDKPQQLSKMEKINQNLCEASTDYDVFYEKGSTAILPCYRLPSKSTVNRMAVVQWLKVNEDSSDKTIWRVDKSGLEYWSNNILKRAQAHQAHFHKGDYSLSIDHLGEDDAGQYKCRVKYGHQEFKVTVNLHILQVEFKKAGEYICFAEMDTLRFHRIVKLVTAQVIVKVSHSAKDGSLATFSITLSEESGVERYEWVKIKKDSNYTNSSDHTLAPEKLGPYFGKTVSISLLSEEFAGEWVCNLYSKEALLGQIPVHLLLTDILGTATVVYESIGGKATFACKKTQNDDKWTYKSNDFATEDIVIRSSKRMLELRGHLPMVKRARIVQDFSLEIKDVESSDEGIYKCSSEGKEYKLCIVSGFRSCLSQSITTVYGPLGGSVVLICTKNGGHKTTLQWLFRKTEFGEEQQIVRQIPSGTITSVNSVPNMPVLESEAVTLHCNPLENDDLVPEISWKPPQGIQLETRDGLHVSNQGKSLMIASVLKKHRGDWICNLKYKEVVKQFTFKMTVIGLNSSPSKVIYSLLHTSVLLPCFIDEGQQSFAMDQFVKSELTGASWKFYTNDKTIPYYGNVSSNTGNPEQSDSLNKSLSITTSLENRGTYICEVQFKRKTLTASVDLDLVQVVPDTTVPVMEGNELNLTCKVDKVVENLKLLWTPTKKNLNFQTNSFPGTATLKIDKVTNQHIGPWRCSLYVGETLMTSVEHKLKIVKPPVDVWLILLVCGSIILFAVLITVICCIIKRCQMFCKIAQLEFKLTTLEKGHLPLVAKEHKLLIALKRSELSTILTQTTEF
ncbi:LAG3 protein, partial [Polypterus senegalus]